MGHGVIVYPPLEFPPEFALGGLGGLGSLDHPCRTTSPVDGVTWSRKIYMPSAIHHNTVLAVVLAVVGLSYFVIIVMLLPFLSVLKN